MRETFSALVPVLIVAAIFGAALAAWWGDKLSGQR
jgi:hypothetical protein